MLQMHGAQQCVCCTPSGERCYYVAIRCECPEGCTAPPEGLIDCNIVENIVGWLNPITPAIPQPPQTSSFVFRSRMFCGSTPGDGYACYTVGLGSQKIILPLPPNSPDIVIPPQLDLQTTPWTEWVFPSCEDCCPGNPPPPFCWARVGICDSGGVKCPGGFVPNTFVALGFQVNGECPPIPDGIWTYQEQCVYVHSSTVTELPPGAVVIAPSNQYETCAECCATPTPCEDCSGCPPTKTYTVGAGDITGGGPPPCNCDPDPTAYFHYEQAIIPLTRIGNTCQYEGSGTVAYTLFAEDENGNMQVVETGNTPISASLVCVTVSPGVTQWRGGDDLWGFTAASSATNAPCPPNGAYNQDITPQPWPPNCCNYPAFFTIG